jgi:TolB protein
MTHLSDMDRLLSDWLETDGPLAEPDGLLQRALIEARGIRQERDRLAPLLRWLPMQLTLRRPMVAPRLVWLLLVLALVVALIGVGLFLAGRPHLPAPFGPARAGPIAFDAGGDIYLVNGDGSGRRVVIGSAADEVSPVWSRDGQRIAYWVKDRVDRVDTLSPWVADADGAHPRPLVPERRLRGDISSPIGWSPDAGSLAFSADVDGFGPGIFIVGTDGRGFRQVVADVAVGADPTWSPDGRSIAYRGPTGTGTFALFVRRLDGVARRLTAPVMEAATDFRYVSWSPDGTELTYTTGAANHHAVAIAKADGSGERLVTDGTGDDIWPAWSNDGTRIAFVRAGGLAVKAMIVGADGTDLHELPSTNLARFGMTWSPDDRLVFAFADAVGTVADTILILPVDGGPPTIVDATGNAGPGNWQRLAP